MYVKLGGFFNVINFRISYIEFHLPFYCPVAVYCESLLQLPQLSIIFTILDA